MAIYGIFYLLDYAIYSLVQFVMRLIILVANYDFFRQDQIQEVADKVYVILGVLVLFKIVISCIEYMVNPDTFDDKDKGMGGILKKTAISIALLVAIRPVFSFAIQMQQSVVSTIPAVIMGTGTTNYTINDSNVKDQLDKIGDLVAGSTIRAFVTMKTVDGSPNGTPKISPDPMTSSLKSFQQNILNGCDKGGLISKYFTTDQCDYDYKWGISTVAGVFLLYVLASMTLDIGIRAIKLGIIQILAPIPISGYIVSKDKLTKFFKLAMNVYLDLFIRLIVVYFIIFFVNEVISSIGNSVTIGDSYVADGVETAFVKIIIIAALFMFAKNAPKFICEVLGIDGGGFGDMADMFKPAWQRYGGFAGAVANPIANAAANWRQSRANGEKKVATNLRRALAGAGRGVADAFAGAAAGDDWKKMRQRHDAAKQKSNERSIRRVNRDKSREQGETNLERAQRLLNEIRGKRERYVTADDRAAAQQEFDRRKQNLSTLAGQIQATTDPAERAKLVAQYRAEQAALADPNFMESTAARYAAIRHRDEEIQTITDKIDGYQKSIDEIDNKLAAGGLTAEEAADLESQKLGLEEKISGAKADIEKITHADERKDAQAALANANQNVVDIDSQISTATANRDAARRNIADLEQSLQNDRDEISDINRQLLVHSEGDQKYTELTNKKKQIEARMQTTTTEIEESKNAEVNYSSSIDQLSKSREEAVAKVDKAKKNVAEVDTKIRAEVQNRIDEYNNYAKQEEKAEREVATAQESIKATEKAIMGARFSGVNSYFGGTTPSGKGYLDLSSFLGSSRSSIYTGEAMTKMRQNADILVDENGEPIRYTSKYCSKPVKYSYEEISSLLNDVKSGNVSTTRLRDEFGFESSAVLQSAFEDIEKSAAADYINANLIAAFPEDEEMLKKYDENGKVRRNADGKPEFSTSVRLKRPTEINSAIVEWWSSFEAELYKNGASKAELDDLRKQFKNNPGKFIQGASTLKDKYAVIGKRLVDSTKPDDGKK